MASSAISRRVDPLLDLLHAPATCPTVSVGPKWVCGRYPGSAVAPHHPESLAYPCALLRFVRSAMSSGRRGSDREDMYADDVRRVKPAISGAMNAPACPRIHSIVPNPGHSSTRLWLWTIAPPCRECTENPGRKRRNPDKASAASPPWARGSVSGL